MNPLAPSTVLQNRYQVIHLIGKGGMGEVYLAIDQRLGNSVALKRTFFNDETMWQAFEREARILANLRHQVLPKVSDHFTENGNQYLVMDYIAGDDLSAIIKKHNAPFPLNQVLTWSDQLLDALEFLHSHKPPIVHRDIKPQNLKFTPNNHIVLLDFGLAKNTVGQTRVSSTGSVVGYTPNYAPMEQVRGTGTEARSDIYSLSATLYQLLTNLIPADTLSRAGDMLEGLPDPMRHVSEVNPLIPRPIGDVIMKGVALRMEQRHANAREMRLRIREAYSASQELLGAVKPSINAALKQANSDLSVTLVDTPEKAPHGFSSQATEVFSTDDVLDNKQNGKLGATPPVEVLVKELPTPESLKETVEFDASSYVPEDYAQKETDSLPKPSDFTQPPPSKNSSDEPGKEVFLETFPVFTDEMKDAARTASSEPTEAFSVEEKPFIEQPVNERFSETFSDLNVKNEPQAPVFERPPSLDKRISPTPAVVKKKSGSRGILALFGVVALLGLLAIGSVGGIYAWKSGLLGGRAANATSVTPSPTPIVNDEPGNNNLSGTNVFGNSTNQNSNEDSSNPNLNTNSKSNNNSETDVNAGNKAANESNLDVSKTPKPTPDDAPTTVKSTPTPRVIAAPTPKPIVVPTQKPVVQPTRPVAESTAKPTPPPKKKREILQ